MSKSGNRHPLKFISDQAIARDALHMYQRVYGGTQPDNGEFGTSFIRGLALHYQHNKAVNWVAQAAHLAETRSTNPSKNPQKLTPPCLREQIQAMVDLFEVYLIRAYKARDVALKQLKDAGLELRGGGRPSRSRLAAIADTSASRSGLLAHVPETVPMKKGQRSGRHHAPCEPSKQVALRPAAKATTPLEALIQKRRVMEEELAAVLQQEENADALLLRHEKQKLDDAKDEEHHWAEIDVLRDSKKAAGLTTEEKANIDMQVRVASASATKASASLEATVLMILKSSAEATTLREKTVQLQDGIGALSGQIDVLIIERSCIRPHQLLSALPTTPIAMRPLKTDLACVICGRFWAEMAMVNLPCGCLLHPMCMFKTALLEHPKCPLCDHIVGGIWMAQWGFATNNETMQASIAASRASMEALGWEAPLHPEAAGQKVNEVLKFLTNRKSCNWSTPLKRKVENCSSHMAEDPAKRICGLPLTMHGVAAEAASANHDDVLQIALDAAAAATAN